MTITTPKSFASVREPVIFQLESDSEACVEVEINGFVKQLPAGATTINVSPYYRGSFTPWPVQDVEAVLKSVNAFDIGRVVGARIVADGAPSKTVALCDARLALTPNRFMSDLFERCATGGVVDELSVYVADEAVVVTPWGRVELEPGVTVVAIRPPEDLPERFSVLLESPDGELLDGVVYRRGETCATRLAWINVYGAVDYWDFEYRRKRSVKVSKDKIYTEAGYTAVTIQQETVSVVVSRSLSEAQTAVVGEILQAECAWRIDAGEAVAIDVTSDSAVLYDAEKPTAIQVEFRDKTK